MDFESFKRFAANITVDSVSICLKEKQSGNVNNKREKFQINPYKESETNKSADANTSKEK